MVSNSEPTAPKRGRPRRFDADETLDRAIDVFWREGYEGADYAKLTLAMGLNKPSIYAAFGDKKALFLHALRRYVTTIASAPVHAMEGETTLNDKLRAFFDRLIANMSGTAHPHGCLLINVAAETAEQDPEVRLLLRTAMETLDASFAAILAGSIAAGELPSTVPVADRGKLWTDCVQAMAMRARAGLSVGELEAVARRATAAILAG